ncbi:DNA-directed RNA polymerase subunit omega [Butyrivibrio sp. NC3005]|uniref:DNA-directed RNA polymerase subunit omega n=1 Tax=Butyrivibrio sp. NC3005 TaxID=1280685 RepID=UPI00042A1382|nr:DNA-directed RNA polymerase subunit omega [Butyrivibrio sp. NC3005]
MIHPSYVDLMNVVNKGVEEGEEPVISSRYSIVMATSKRARQIIAGDEVMIDASPRDKALTVAVNELYQDKLGILTDEEKIAMAETIAKKNAEADAEESNTEKAGDKEGKKEDKKESKKDSEESAEV